MNADFTAGFTWLSTIFLRPQSPREREQVIFDIGPDGKSVDRFQFFIDLDGSLVLRAKDKTLRVPEATATSLFNEWHTFSVRAKAEKGKLTLHLYVTAEMNWSEKFEFNGPLQFGPRMTLGSTLSGQYGLEMLQLDMAAWGRILKDDELEKIMDWTRKRPQAFGLQHGMQ